MRRSAVRSRLGVAAAVAVTGVVTAVGASAVGVPSLLSVVSAAAGDTLTLNPPSSVAPRGFCVPYTATYAATTPGRAYITVKVTPISASEVVSFCNGDPSGDGPATQDGPGAPGEAVFAVLSDDATAPDVAADDGKISFGVRTVSGTDGVDVLVILSDDGTVFAVDPDEANATSRMSIAAPTPPAPTATSSASASATPTATATSTASPTVPPPSPTAPTCLVAAIRVGTPTINATGTSSVTVSNVRPGRTIELQGYSQNHAGTQSFANDPTPVDRRAVADSRGSATFTDLRLSSNTRLRAREAGCSFGDSAVVNVRTQLSLIVTRTATRTYTFSGKAIPARSEGLIVSLYRIVGAPCAAGVDPRSCPGEVLIGQDRADPVSGAYSLTRVFGAADRFVRDEFVLKTGQDSQNAPGRSNVRSLLIF